MNTQEMLDWVLAQRISQEKKLVLCVLAWKANAEGGGSIDVRALARIASCTVEQAWNLIEQLQAAGLLVAHYTTIYGPIDFGLCIHGNAAQ